MDDDEIAGRLLSDHFEGSAALIALMLKDLPEFVWHARSRLCANASTSQLATGA